MLNVMQMNLHTGSREDGLGSDGEEDESDDLDLYLSLHMDEVCTKGNKIKKQKEEKMGGGGGGGGSGCSIILLLRLLIVIVSYNL